MFPTAVQSQTEHVYQWLVNSTRSCNQSGDLWYYRGLVARRLGNTSDARYAFGKADENGSKAKLEGFDPFSIGVGVRVSSPKHIRDKFALIVGISNFQNPDARLQFSGNDAIAMRALLTSSLNFKDDGDHIHMLIDDKATLANIEQAMGEIRANVKSPDDLVFIFLSSHGVPRTLGPDGISYVMTYDFDSSDDATAYRTGLKMVELAEFGRFIKANNYVLVLDTCYSGAVKQVVPEGSDGFDPLKGLQGSANRVVISASRAEEQSIEDKSSKHGLFTHFFLDALIEKRAPDLAGIFKVVQEKVIAEAEKQKAPQHPVMLAYADGGSILVGLPVEAKQNSPVE